MAICYYAAPYQTATGSLTLSSTVSASTAWTNQITWYSSGTTTAPWFQPSGYAGVAAPAYEEPRESREAREQMAEVAREHAAAARERENARSRARVLLLAVLTPEQAADYTERDWFEVRGSHGGRWRIRRNGQAGNVDLMPEGGSEPVASFCAHPPGSLPDADAHLAQLLALVTDEDAFTRVAHRIDLHRDLQAA
jgi:hypothetical protein